MNGDMTLEELRTEAVKVNKRIYCILSGFETRTGVRVRDIEVRRARITRNDRARRAGDIEFVGVKVDLGDIDRIIDRETEG